MDKLPFDIAVLKRKGFTFEYGLLIRERDDTYIVYDTNEQEVNLAGIDATDSSQGYAVRCTVSQFRELITLIDSWRK